MEKYVDEYDYLIHLIKCAIRGYQPDEKPEKLSFEKIFEYGRIHEVANIAFVSIQKLQSKPDTELYKKWQTIFAFSVQRHTNQMFARDTIVKALDRAEIRSVEVQGSVMKNLYPDPTWRMMSDIDFIIDRENLNKAEEIMKSLGYRTKNNSNVEIDGFGPYGIAVELHSDFFDSRSDLFGIITNVFDTAIPMGEGFSYKADFTIFYLYNILHCIKHYSNRGAGIRRILDMYILYQNRDKINLMYINEVLEKYDLKETADTIMALAIEWFGDISGEKDLKEIANMVYMAGNHGTIQVNLMNEYKKTEISNKGLFKLYKVISLLFPKKEVIYDAYPYCRKQKLPVIFGWIYRGGCIISDRKRRKNAIEKLNEIRKAKIC